MQKTTMKYTSKACSLAAALITFGSLAGGANAATIVENTSATGGTLGGSGYWGQSFTTTTGMWNNIEFSWIASNGVTEIAAGNVFLLSIEYLGSPSALGVSTPGFIAESIGVNAGRYVFAGAVTLNPSTQYWIYMGDDSPLAGGGYANPPGNYGGGNYYQPNSFTIPTDSYGAQGGIYDATFRVSGTAVPEPTASLLLGFGGLLLARRTRRTI